MAGRRDAFCFVKAESRGDVELVARLMDVKDAARVSGKVANSAIDLGDGDVQSGHWISTIQHDAAASSTEHGHGAHVIWL